MLFVAAPLRAAPALRSPPPAAADSLRVCNGGQCGQFGGSLLLDAASALAGASPIAVTTQNCCGECPDGVIVRPCSASSYLTVDASSLQLALDAAAGALDAAGVSVEPGLREAFGHHHAAKVEEELADVAAALSEYSAAIGAMPASVLQPWQPPLEPEPLLWPGTAWLCDQPGGGPRGRELRKRGPSRAQLLGGLPPRRAARAGAPRGQGGRRLDADAASAQQGAAPAPPPPPLEPSPPPAVAVAAWRTAAPHHCHPPSPSPLPPSQSLTTAALPVPHHCRPPSPPPSTF